MTPSRPPLLQVGVRYSFTSRAGTTDVPGKGAFQEKFASGAFDRSLGTVIPLKLETRAIGHARIISADVASDGLSVVFTYEVTDLDPR